MLDLEKQVADLAGDLAVYRTELFDASTITRLLGHLQQGLRAAVRQPPDDQVKIAEPEFRQ